MADVEKVISALECVIQYGPHYCGGEFGDENEYSRIGQNVLMDALALLKAQEPVEPKLDVDEWRCGNCGHKLEHQELLGDNVLFHEQYNYCPNCGKAVKWE